MMQQIGKLFREIEDAISAEVIQGRRTFRGAAVVTEDDPARPLLVIYGYKGGKQIEVAPADFQKELEIVRAGLPKIGFDEVLTYGGGEVGYFVIGVPAHPFEAEVDSEDFDQLTEKGYVEFHFLLKRLTDLAWHAWAVTHDVTLPGLAPS